MEDHEEVYGDDRSEQLRRLLREFAAHVAELDRAGRLLATHSSPGIWNFV